MRCLVACGHTTKRWVPCRNHLAPAAAYYNNDDLGGDGGCRDQLQVPPEPPDPGSTPMIQLRWQALRNFPSKI